MVLQQLDKRPRIHPPKLVVGALLPFQTHPDPADSQSDELIDRIGLQDARGAEDINSPAFRMGLHQFQKPERPLLVEQEILVQCEKGPDLEFFLHLAHHGEELVTRFIEIDKIPFAAEKGGG